MTIRAHKLVGATFVPTKKQGDVITPKAIVIHFTAGWTTTGDVATLSKGSGNVSVQLVLSREGKWTQIVPFNRKAWHAGPSKYKNLKMLNGHSIGIEISNAGAVKQLAPDLYEDYYGNRITGDGKFIGKNRRTSSPIRDWPHFKHRRLGSAVYAFEPYTDEQIKAMDDVIPQLLAAYPTIKYIVTHEEIDTRGWKTDPGPLFPMERYTKLVGHDAFSNPAVPVHPHSRTPAPPNTPVGRPRSPVRLVEPAKEPAKPIVITPPNYVENPREIKAEQPAKEPAKVLPWYKRYNFFWR